MKVVNLKAAKAAIERKRYATGVLAAFDKLQHEIKREQLNKAAEVRRAARSKT